MKQRWLKSVVKHSEETLAPLPWHRAARQARKRAQLFDLLRSLKSA